MVKCVPRRHWKERVCVRAGTREDDEKEDIIGIDIVSEEDEEDECENWKRENTDTAMEDTVIVIGCSSCVVAAGCARRALWWRTGQE